MQATPSAIIASLVVLATVLVVPGCSSLGFGVRERAEGAFRKQNQLSTEFMLDAEKIESMVPAMYESLLAKETLMLDACQPLNSAASNQQDQQSPGFHEKRAILHSLESCEKATLTFEEYLRLTQRRSDAP